MIQRADLRVIAIPGWEGMYAAREDGAILSLPRLVLMVTGRDYPVRGRVLKSLPLSNGYLGVTLNDAASGRRWQETVHRLVALVFVPNPNGKSQVNHLNSDRHDNRSANLEWVTPQENTRHMIAAGHWKPIPNRWAHS